jgi:large subunit ribosomal protein L31
MKENLHPTYYPDALVICSCGNTFHTGSTRKEIRTDLCSNCHPFYTGEQRIVDTAGQVDRFMKRLEATTNAATKGAPAPKKPRRNLIETVGEGEA